MPQFKITFEGKQSVEEIQRKFHGQLSEQEILKTTARALNETAKKVQGFIRKEIKQHYTVNNKYLQRGSYISHYAKGEVSGLYATVNYSYRTIPIIGFKHTGIKGKKDQTISVEIRRGKSTEFKHAFIATMRNQTKGGEYSNHEGIYAAGRYAGKDFVYENEKTKSGRTRVTELRSASILTMATSLALEPAIKAYIDKTLPSRLEYFLQQKVNKMKQQF